MAGMNIKQGLQEVLSKIDGACKRRPAELGYFKPRLVAVSKTKPANVIIEAYEEGQRHFGENYVQELVEKASNADILSKCTEIQWHFIGHLQSNKINKVLGIPHLFMIETVDSQSLAASLNQKWPQFGPPETKLNVLLQVNTSQEKAKSGIDPSELINLATFVNENCPNLKIKGLMTIGQFDVDETLRPNPDFLCLRNCRDAMCEQLHWDTKDVELSMGMSADYEHAIEMGSTNVRVGSSIFGSRPLK